MAEDEVMIQDVYELLRGGRKAHGAKVGRVCKTCGNTFDVMDDGRYFYCSEQCYRASVSTFNARRRAVTQDLEKSEIIDPLLVFERDGWRCHICGRKTPKRLRGTKNNRAPEVDHVLPLAKGGTHTYDNVACACKECNMRKHANIVGQLGLGLVCP